MSYKPWLNATQNRYITKRENENRKIEEESLRKKQELEKQNNNESIELDETEKESN